MIALLFLWVQVDFKKPHMNFQQAQPSYCIINDHDKYEYFFVTLHLGTYVRMYIRAQSKLKYMADHSIMYFTQFAVIYF